MYFYSSGTAEKTMWDRRYAEPGFVYGKEPNDFLKSEYARIPRGGRVLCLAEGEGRNAIFLAKQGYLVTAVDRSAVGLKKAVALASEQGVEIEVEVADLADYKLGCEKWDGIVSISAHVPPALRRNLHARVATALQDRGIFLLEAYTKEQLEMAGVGGPPAAQQELFMSLRELTTELSDLNFIIGRETKRELSEGKYHQGNSAVVQVIACKGLKAEN